MANRTSKQNTDLILADGPDSQDKRFKEVTELAYILQNAKCKTYGMSCYKRGMTGVAHNIYRKTDRLDSFDPTVWENPDTGKGEPILDTLFDTANYCFKAITGYMVTHPEEYEKFKQSVLALQAQVEKDK